METPISSSNQKPDLPSSNFTTPTIFNQSFSINSNVFSSNVRQSDPMFFQTNSNFLWNFTNSMGNSGNPSLDNFCEPNNLNSFNFEAFALATRPRMNTNAMPLMNMNMPLASATMNYLQAFYNARLSYLNNAIFINNINAMKPYL